MTKKKNDRNLNKMI